MRTPIIILCLFIGRLLSAQVLYDKCEIHEIAETESRGYPGWTKDDRLVTPRGYDMKYHRMDLHVDPAVRAIQGTVTHVFRSTAALTALVFDLSSDLNVDSIRYHEAPLTGFSENDLLAITLPQPIDDGILDSITISWSGIPPVAGLGSFNQATHSGTPVLWTLSEPYGASDWWPCKEDLEDKADSLDMFVTVPNGQRVASNGLLLSQDPIGSGKVRFHWRHRYPIAHYLIAFAATNYAVYSDFVPLQDRVIEVQNYVYPEDSLAASEDSPMLIEQMQLYSDLFGEYPFANEQYGHAQFNYGGGMEHQTMSFMGGFSFELMAHELAHQWFGDKVTCGSWEDLWLNEGFATYLSGICYEQLAPEKWLPFKYSQRDNITSRSDGSVRVQDTTSIPRLFSGRLTYAKGAFLVHMLRWVCGDDAFYAGCRNYLADPALQYGSARTPQLKAHLEATSGIDLTEFFADWYVGEGYPIYKIRWSQNMDNTITVEVDQTTSHPSVQFFEMPIPMRFANSESDTTLIFDHTYSGQRFTFQLPFSADSAQFDPEVWVLSGQTVISKIPPAAFESDRLVAYPNPATDQLSVFVGMALFGTVTVSVSDPSGRVVMSWTDQVRQGQLDINIQHLASGVYHLGITSEDRNAVVQFVKQ
ncbi:MAG: T9SS type A sorting domain-containing protein [Flavobacteriales bacterium]|jgi:aminopeptidase N|nr:T9SS type A sorting domain-containing protein [Flavobacteriales bacterium]